MGKKIVPRRRIIANKFHFELIKLFVIACLVPAIIVALLFYYYLNTSVASTVLLSSCAPVSDVVSNAHIILIALFILTPVGVLSILFFTRKVTHTIVGPYDRILREIDDIIEGKKKTPIQLRKGDKFQSLVDRINKLVDKGNK